MLCKSKLYLYLEINMCDVMVYVRYSVVCLRRCSAKQYGGESPLKIQLGTLAKVEIVKV